MRRLAVFFTLILLDVPGWAEYTPVPTQSLELSPDLNVHRLGFGVRTVAVADDFEFFHVPTWPGRTEFGMYVNPFFDYKYNDSASVELGGIFEDAYGGNTATDNSNEIENAQAWLRISTHPFKNMIFRLGNLAYPHGFYSPIFFPSVQYETKLTEKGIQILYDDGPGPDRFKNDFFYSYEHQDLPSSPLEKFDFGDVLQKHWGPMRFDYQADWIHHGGQETSTTRMVSDDNDTVQLIGPGLDFDTWGLTADYLISHYSQQLEAGQYTDTKGNAQFAEIYKVLFGKFRVSYIYWNMFQYRHGDITPNSTDITANPVFIDHPWAQAFTFKWNSTWTDFMRISIEYLGYNFPGASPGKFLPIESEIHMKASYEFHVPILEWKTKKEAPIQTDSDFKTAPAGTAGPQFDGDF